MASKRQRERQRANRRAKMEAIAGRGLPADTKFVDFGNRRNRIREDYVGYRNNELYADPTAYAALNNVIRESRSRRYNASF